MRLLQGMPRGGLQCLLMAFLMFDVCYPSSLKIKCSDLNGYDEYKCGVQWL